MTESKGSTECPVRGSASGDVCPVNGGVNNDVCPVKHNAPPDNSSSTPSLFGRIYSYFGGQSTPAAQPDSPLTPNGSSAKSDGYNTAANDLVFGHQPQPGQKIAMSQKRTISTIPKVFHFHMNFLLYHFDVLLCCDDCISVTE